MSHKKLPLPIPRQLPRRIRETLTQNNFVLVRQKNHLVFKHSPSGKQVSINVSGSDYRWEENCLSDIRKVLKSVGVEAKETPKK